MIKDTVLISIINNADFGLDDVAYKTPLAPHKKSRFWITEGTFTRLAKKELTEVLHQKS